MTGIFEQLIKSKTQAIFVDQRTRPVDTRFQEIFGAGPQDVDEMVQTRIEELKGLC